MTYPISLNDVSYAYGKNHALNEVTTEIQAGTITGLLGRNGSGKTTLGMLLAGQLKATGTLRVKDEDPWENPELMPNTVLVTDSTSIFLDSKLNRTTELWRLIRPNWSEDLYEELMDLWGLDGKKTYSSLSRGQQSAYIATLGLASRGKLTIFDEVHLGMDVVVRQEFYDTLLREFAHHPRTIILSSHLVPEIENIVEDVLIIDRGSVVAAGNADDLRTQHGSDGRQATLTDVLIGLTGRRDRS